MKIDVKKIAGWLAPVILILSVLGISAASLSNNVKNIWRAPAEIVKLKAEIVSKDSIINLQENRIDHLQNQVRMFYETDRTLTDRFDSIWYEITLDDGTKYDVHIRTTNEGAMIGFISDLWIQYPVYYDTDGLMYITPHQPDTHVKKGTYLKVKQ